MSHASSFAEATADKEDAEWLWRDIWWQDSTVGLSAREDIEMLPTVDFCGIKVTRLIIGGANGGRT